MATATENASQNVRNATETVAQNARFVTDQTRVMADTAVDAGRQLFDAYQAASSAWLEGAFQVTNRWFEVSRVMLDQAEIASREGKATLEALAAQARRQQDTVLKLSRENGKIVQDTWLGAYRNGRSA